MVFSKSGFTMECMQEYGGKNGIELVRFTDMVSDL